MAGHRLILAYLSIIFYLTYGLSPAAAEESSQGLKPSSAPIEVTSKKMTAKMLPQGVELTFEGRVKVKQDDMILACDKLVGFYEEDKKNRNGSDIKTKKSKDMASSVRSAVASGNVKITKGELKAEAGKAVLDNQKRTATLSEGPPQVWQGPHMLTAHTIVIYLDENRAELLGGEDTGIRATLNPAKTKNRGGSSH